MGKETLMFGDIEIEKSLIAIKSLLFKKMLILSEKVLVSSKYFIVCLCNDHKVKPLHIMLPKARFHVKSYDGQTKWMYFLIEDDDLLEK